MSSALATRSHPTTRYKSCAPYPASDAPHASISVAQSRQHRPAARGDYWQVGSAVTYVGADTKVFNPYALRDECGDSTHTTHPYHQPQSADRQNAPPSPQDAQPTNYDLVFPPLPTTNGFSDRAVGEQLVETNQRQYFGSPSIPHHKPRCTSQSQNSQSVFTSFNEAPSYAYVEFPHDFISPTTHAIEPAVYYDDLAQYKDNYQSDAAHSRPTSGYAHSYFTTSRPHTSYDNDPHAISMPTACVERRVGTAGSTSYDEPFAYQVADHQDSAYSLPGYGLVQHTPYSSSPLVPALPASSAPEEQRPQSLSFSHTSADNPSCDPLASVDSEPLAPAPPTVTSSPPAPEIGSAKSVRRRRRTTADTRRRQSEQLAVVNQTPKRTRTNKSTSLKSRRSKPNQTSTDLSPSSSDDETTSSDNEGSDCDSKSAGTAEKKFKQLALRYKTAYKRVRLQRNFFEGTTVSLLHEVRILGGDPLQASRQPSKGEDMDPKKARILIASLQGDLEDSRERLLKAETELHRLREIVDNAPQVPHSFENDDSKAPLSAAPKTIFAHLRK